MCVGIIQSIEGIDKKVEKEWNCSLLVLDIHFLLPSNTDPPGSQALGVDWNYTISFSGTPVYSQQTVGLLSLYKCIS